MNSHIILSWKQTLLPQASLQQLLLPGLIMEQTLLQGSLDGNMISQMRLYTYWFDAEGLFCRSTLSLASITVKIYFSYIIDSIWWTTQSLAKCLIVISARN